MWLNHPQIKELVRSHWQSPTNGSRAMQVMSGINHTAKDNLRQDFIKDSDIPPLSNYHIAQLAKPFTIMEIETALLQMNGTKAPGPDGMPPIFFQHFWDIVGDDLTGMINGDYIDWFSPSAGLRQGDPLSPYLFVLCTNVLSSYLVKA
ncbi:Transposon TX1 uncharacterized 149 kDa protein [Senna tora]|uniref:Transposon TX1 uncharacterized 149 kDa protein n=1 Tax=Senna tora TaxID=362788 RepID=A0A835C990_9FABA|nr:Transposon TX1 uncharacterized 149 kDa protein [Senna tora]